MKPNEFVYWLMGYVNRLNTKGPDSYKDVSSFSGLKASQWNEILKALRQVELKD